MPSLGRCCECSLTLMIDGEIAREGTKTLICPLPAIMGEGFGARAGGSFERRLLASARAWEEALMISHLNEPDVPASSLPFSPATRIGNLLFVSGQASTDEQGAIVPDTFEGEFRRSMENLRRILQSAGADLDRIVQVRAYVRDP